MFWSGWFTHACLRRAGSHPRAALLMLLLQGFFPWMFQCILVSVSSVWTWHGCKQKRFNWFGSGSCWDRLSPLKHAWHTEIMRAHYHIKGGRSLFPHLCKTSWLSLMLHMVHFISNKGNEFVHEPRFCGYGGGRSINHSWSFLTQRQGWFMCGSY